jgi:hypothetical protein
MVAVSLALALATLAGWAGLALLGAAGRRAILPLPPAGPGPRPSVTAVVPCRNEARSVGAAMRSLLAQDHPALAVVAVDDRSTDGTGTVLDHLAAADPRLSVVHVGHLPPGWLGKNHACHVGAERARSEWLLFTDADVLFAPDALSRAVAAAERHGLGHLAVLPHLVAPGLLERAFVTFFAAFLGPLARVHALRRTGTRAYFGVGAFNLVRRDAYERAGGHRRLPLEVVDDLKLGLLLRRGGVPQGVAEASAAVRVRWQHGFAASVLGLVKNAFAALEYRTGRAVLAAAGATLAGVTPVALLAAGPTPAVRAVAGAALAVAVLHHAESARRLAGATGIEGLLAPCCALLLGAAVGTSAAAAWLRGGVVWRGTHYRLDAVRAGCLRERDLPASGAVGWPGHRERRSSAGPPDEASAERRPSGRLR